MTPPPAGDSSGDEGRPGIGYHRAVSDERRPIHSGRTTSAARSGSSPDRPRDQRPHPARAGRPATPPATPVEHTHGDAARNRPATPPAPAPGAAGLAPVSFDDLVLMEPADIGYEEVEVRVTVHGERLVVFNLDAGRVVHQIYYRGRGPAGAETLIGLPRLLTGSERWFILPTSTGDVVLRLDLDSSGEMITAYEARSGTKVPRVRGELAK